VIDLGEIRPLLMRLALLVCAMSVFMLDVTDAHAQSRNCATLLRSLSAIENNRGFDGPSSSELRRLERAVQSAESRYIRSGCNDAAKRGDRVTSSCRTQGRAVLSARESLEAANARGQTAAALEQQREAILQEMSRFGCDTRSRANVRESGRGNLFEQLFGGFGDGVSTRGDDFEGFAGYNTVRTVCVRQVDGYYWPISYSTLPEYAQNDLMECQAQCPGKDVDLYYYSNPGQEPQQMVNLYGQPYTALPTAFAYRQTYDIANKCGSRASYGSLELVAMPDGSNRAMISYNGETVPLPLRDPRRPSNITVVAAVEPTYLDVPLPRRRPPAPGEAPAPVVVQQAANDPLRIVQFGDKRVRIVGPDTPYAPTAATGT
jgi:hypothetical protein